MTKHRRLIMSKEGERKCGAYRLLDPAKGKRDPNWRQVSKVEELKERWQRVKGRRDRDRMETCNQY